MVLVVTGICVICRIVNDDDLRTMRVDQSIATSLHFVVPTLITAFYTICSARVNHSYQHRRIVVSLWPK